MPIRPLRKLVGSVLFFALGLQLGCTVEVDDEEAMAEVLAHSKGGQQSSEKPLEAGGCSSENLSEFVRGWMCSAEQQEWLRKRVSALPPDDSTSNGSQVREKFERLIGELGTKLSKYLQSEGCSDATVSRAMPGFVRRSSSNGVEAVLVKHETGFLSEDRVRIGLEFAAANRLGGIAVGWDTGDSVACPALGSAEMAQSE